MRESEVADSYFYPELPPREIFVNKTRSTDEPPMKEASSVSAIYNDKDSFDGKKLPPKARFFTFEGLTPVSTVDDSREDRPDEAGREVSPLPRVKECPEDRTQPVMPFSDDQKDDAVQKRRCWSLTLEEAPFDEDPMVPHGVPQSCPNSVVATKATPVRRMAPVDECPSDLGRADTPSDVSETSLRQRKGEPSFEPNCTSPTLDEPAEALPTPVELADTSSTPAEPAEALATLDEPVGVLPTPVEASPAQKEPPITTKTSPSSLFDEDDDEDDWVATKDYEAIIIAPSDEMEDRKTIESSILREAEAADGCDVNICKHLVSSSNDICQSFSKLLSI